VTNVDAVELRDLKWTVVHVARSKDTRLLSILRPKIESMTATQSRLRMICAEPRLGDDNF
jgi:hypothetical protein